MQYRALTFAIGFTTLIGFATPMAHAQDAKAGKRVFAKCRACHKIGPAALKQKAIGPHLNGLIGRKAAAVAGYKYSKAMKNSGVTWTEEEFTRYIQNPRTAIKGNRMAFVGLRDARDIKDLMAYLKTFKADGTAAGD